MGKLRIIWSVLIGRVQKWDEDEARGRATIWLRPALRKERRFKREQRDRLRESRDMLYEDRQQLRAEVKRLRSLVPAAALEGYPEGNKNA